MASPPAKGPITTLEDALAVIAELREENGRRRTKLREYEELFVGVDDTGRDWLKETIRLMRENPKEAGLRWSKLGLSNLGEDEFIEWVESTIRPIVQPPHTANGSAQEANAMSNTDNTSPPGGFSPTGQAPSGQNVGITREELNAALQGFAQHLTESLGQTQQQQEQAAFMAEAKSLGYVDGTWQFNMLVDAAVEKEGDLTAAHSLVQERLGTPPTPTPTLTPTTDAPVTPTSPGPPVTASVGIIDPPVAKAATLKEASAMARAYLDGVDAEG